MHLPVLVLFLVTIFFGHCGAASPYHSLQSSEEASTQQDNFEFMNGATPEHLFFKGSTIPYEFDSQANITADQLDLIKQQMERIVKNTCVRFIPRTNEKRFLLFKIGGESCGLDCSRGETGCTLDLGAWCLEHAGVIEHELLHSVGLGHEHQRYDRDEYIEIVWENVKNGSQSFNKDRCEMHGTYGCPYNFDSTVHYPANAFSKNGKITIRALDPKYQEVMGKRYMSNLGAHPNDYEMVNRMRGCKQEVPGHTCEPLPCEISPNCPGYKRVVTASPLVASK